VPSSRIVRYIGPVALMSLSVIAWWFLFQSDPATNAAANSSLLMKYMMRPSEIGQYIITSFIMWVVMMIAMMTPALMIMVVVFQRLDRNEGYVNVFVFASGYFIIWSVFAGLAAALQWWFNSSGWLDGHIQGSKSMLAGGTLIAAGIYQLTPLKEACLDRCRSPVSFFLDYWKPGRSGALRMGLHHGLLCLGCCWGLMLTMFAGGTSSVLVMALLSAFILAERLIPSGPWSAKIPGIILLGLGIAFLTIG